MIDSNLNEIIIALGDTAKVLIKDLPDGFQTKDLLDLFPLMGEFEAAAKDANHGLNYLIDLNPEKEADVIDAILKQMEDASEKTKALVTYILRGIANLYMAYKNLKTTQDSGV